MRSGLLAKKVGMTHIYSETGVHLAVTVLSVGDCIVTGHRTPEKHGYTAVQLGIGSLKGKHSTRAMMTSFEKAGVEPRRALREFRTNEVDSLAVGTALKADYFTIGQFVDIAGVSVGKGFQGVIKRHHFGGGRATHGNSVSHRSHGSTGNRQDPGRVFKNKKMAGHMGDRRVTNQNIKVVAVDVERNLIFVHGSVPGSKDSLVYIKDSVKKPVKA